MIYSNIFKHDCISHIIKFSVCRRKEEILTKAVVHNIFFSLQLIIIFYIHSLYYFDENQINKTIRSQRHQLMPATKKTFHLKFHDIPIHPPLINRSPPLEQSYLPTASRMSFSTLLLSSPVTVKPWVSLSISFFTCPIRAIKRSEKYNNMTQGLHFICFYNYYIVIWWDSDCLL